MGAAANFLVIGAARSGTTALTSFLGEHPDVFVSTPKEPHFLAFPDGAPRFTGLGDDDLVNRTAVRGEAAWRALFEGRAEARLGEGSVTTLAHPDAAIPAIERCCAPGCRLVVMLRDPVDRAFSSWLYLRSRGYDAGTFEECLAAEEERTRAGWSHMWQLAGLSRYAGQLAPFAAAFGDRLLVVVQEEFAADPTGQLRRVLEFLQVDPGVDIDPSRRVNASGLPRSRAVTSALNTLRRSRSLRRLVTAAVPHRQRERIRSANLDPAGIDPATRSRLADSFADDVGALQELLGRRLTAWPTAEHVRGRS
ncbi:sulfotransferase [Blastococcus sp. MG754426]|uniref:sulfotransferase family protein n=1 Tax=unclassified Blastococcus TaxID=2619396 RepID=UPI001EF0EAB7|nr:MULTISPECIES: sulfotransferase [unclassified Blastococcus]MCF6508556.1 sulfotransferase [Blastococcus sp. MG754426]MCF6510747.1 sulfotransferase [Blastococcus sp. MG754427]